MAGFIAKAALVVAKDESGRDVYVYEGQPVPANVTSESLARLEAEGFIAPIAEPEEESNDFPEGEPTDAWTNKQLTAYAETLSIDLGEAKKKDEILAAIAAASA